MTLLFNIGLAALFIIAMTNIVGHILKQILLYKEDREQPDPIKNNNTPICDQVIADLKKRKEDGIKKYGVPLQANNGRDGLQDLYEELLDAAQYVKQVMVERDVKKS